MAGELGLSLAFTITTGQVADCTKAIALLAECPTVAVIADKGYDSDALVKQVGAAGAKAVIPPREAIAESSAEMTDTSIESETRSNAVSVSSSNISALPIAARNHKHAFTPAHGSCPCFISIWARA